MITLDRGGPRISHQLRARVYPGRIPVPITWVRAPGERQALCSGALLEAARRNARRQPRCRSQVWHASRWVTDANSGVLADTASAEITCIGDPHAANDAGKVSRLLKRPGPRLRLLEPWSLGRPPRTEICQILKDGWTRRARGDLQLSRSTQRASTSPSPKTVRWISLSRISPNSWQKTGW